MKLIKPIFSEKFKEYILSQEEFQIRLITSEIPRVGIKKHLVKTTTFNNYSQASINKKNLVNLQRASRNPCDDFTNHDDDGGGGGDGGDDGGWDFDGYDIGDDYGDYDDCGGGGPGGSGGPSGPGGSSGPSGPGGPGGIRDTGWFNITDENGITTTHAFHIP